MVSDPAVRDRRNEMTKSRDDYKSYSRCRDITAASHYAQPSDSATEAGGRVSPLLISGAHTQVGTASPCGKRWMFLITAAVMFCDWIQTGVALRHTLPSINLRSIRR